MDLDDTEKGDREIVVPYTQGGEHAREERV